MKEINIRDIKINRENPRHNPTLFEEEAIKLLCLNNQKMIDLCESILSKSYYQQSIISVIQDDDKYIAIDGNRRLCSLKLLNGLILVPKGQAYTKLRNYLEDKVIDHQFVNCVVYQDEAEAANYILEIHTSGSDVEKWNQIQQYKYMKRFNKKTVTGYELLLNYYDHPEEISNPTTIKRIFSNEDVKKLLKINDDGTVNDNLMSKHIKDIINDINEKKEDSRTLNTSADIVNYVSRKIEPNSNAVKIKPKSVSVQKKMVKINERKLRINKNDLTLLPIDCTYMSTFNKLNKIIQELISLNIEKYTYSSVILYRSFLQISLKYYSLISEWKGYNNDNLEGSLNSINNFVFGQKGIEANKGRHSQIKEVLNANGKFIQIINGYTHDLETEVNKTIFLDVRSSFTPLLNHVYIKKD